MWEMVEGDFGFVGGYPRARHPCMNPWMCIYSQEYSFQFVVTYRK